MLIFYDFEVFMHDWLVVFSLNGKEDVVIVNDREALIKFYEEHQQKVFVGVNNKRYDDIIFKSIMKDKDPYVISHAIIVKKTPSWNFDDRKIKILSIDVLAEIVGFPSLKQIESNLGMSIEESSVDFHINRKLTEEEIKETIAYCKFDVEATKNLYNIRYKSLVEPKLLLIKEFKLEKKFIGETMINIICAILESKKRTYFDEFIYTAPSNLKLNKYNFLLETIYKAPLDYTDSVKCLIEGTPHTFQFGGLHGAKKNYSNKKRNLLLIDVESYYPNLIINNDYFSRNIESKTKEKYKNIMTRRIGYKRIKHVLNTPFKLVLNKTFGAEKYPHCSMYDPQMANHICISGQLYLVMLIEMLSKYIILVQSNTDGIIVEYRSQGGLQKIREVYREWENMTGFKLEETFLKELHQKDVNNYVALLENDEVVCKGSYVSKYNKTQQESFDKYNLVILDECVVNSLLYNISPEKTILENTDMSKYMLTCSRSKQFEKTIFGSKTNYIEVNKVNRVFASKIKNNKRIYKVKNGVPHLFPNSPEHVFIWNDEMSSNKYTHGDLDLDWYINKAYARIEDFKTGKSKR